MQIILCINHENGDKTEKRYHITYVIEVPYDTYCIEDFNETRKVLIDIHFRLGQFQKLIDSMIFKYPFINRDSIVDDCKVVTIDKVSFVKNSLIVEFVNNKGEKKKLVEEENKKGSLCVRLIIL